MGSSAIDYSIRSAFLFRPCFRNRQCGHGSTRRLTACRVQYVRICLHHSNGRPMSTLFTRLSTCQLEQKLDTHRNKLLPRPRPFCCYMHMACAIDNSHGTVQQLSRRMDLRAQVSGQVLRTIPLQGRSTSLAPFLPMHPPRGSEPANTSGNRLPSRTFASKVD
jgi:hypothetical protein